LRACANRANLQLVAAGVAFHIRGQIERDEREAGLAVLGIVKADDVLMLLGASLQLQTPAHVHIGVLLVVVAGQAFRCLGESANGDIVLADEDSAVAAEGVFVIGLNFVLRVRARVRDDADAQLPLAEAKVNVGGFVVVVIGDNLGARIDGKAEVGSRGGVGVHMDAAEGCVHLHVLIFAVGAFLHVDPAGGDPDGQGEAG
jgi:hypothetical protein